ncbi:MAG: Do family serine endopeptidase [Planctomycetaceae bacterium]
MNKNDVRHPSRWLAGLGVFGLGTALAVQSLFSAPVAAVAVPPSPAAVASANDLSSAFRSASEAVLPSVVTIRNEQVVTQVDESAKMPQGENSLPQGIPDEFGPLLKRFFGDQVPQMPQMPRGGSGHMPHSMGMGSGVIIDSSGLILTNNHVAGGGGKVTVQLHDGREFEATEVKTDPQSDIAIVKIEGAGILPAAKLGDSDKLEIGDWVLAVGAPFGLQETVTAGIISAKSRGVNITERADFLQTDAAINPGNSGGPMVNVHGEVVGINTAISTSGGGNEGIGFAVPINQAKWVSDQLIAKGSVERAFLGVGIQQLNSDLAKQLGLKSVHGALVSEVRPGSPAEHAGIHTGDVIVEFNGKQVDNPHRLQNLVERANMKSDNTVVVVRDGDRKEVAVALQPLPNDTAIAKTETASAAPQTKVESIGLEVADLTPDVAKQLGFKDDVQGVVITGVASGSKAEQAGLETGMLVARVGNKEVHTAKEFEAAVNGATDGGLLMLVKTTQGSRFIVLK